MHSGCAGRVAHSWYPHLCDCVSAVTTSLLCLIPSFLIHDVQCFTMENNCLCILTTGQYLLFYSVSSFFVLLILIFFKGSFRKVVISGKRKTVIKDHL